MMKLIKNLSEDKTILIVGVIYTISITVAFLIPIGNLPKINLLLPLDKLVHGFIFIILVFIWLWYYFIKKNKRILSTSIFAILISCFIYGILIEILQSRIDASKNSDYLDIFANSVGLILGTVLFLKLKTRIKT